MRAVTAEDLQPLTDAELVKLAELLARYAAHDLDQFDHWSLRVPWGTAYVEVSTEPRPDVAVEVYTPIWPTPQFLRDRTRPEGE